MSPPDQRMVIEQAKFAYSPSGKVFEKQTKTIEDQGKKQINAIEDHGKQLYHLIKEKEIFDELIEERPSGFRDLEKRINLDNLIYQFKNERISSKYFRNY